MLSDLRDALRLLSRSPGFSAAAITIVALAIGANTAMFSVVQALLLRPLPYPDSDRIVRVLERLPGGAINSISTLNYLDWASENTVFEYMAAEAGWRVTLTGMGEPVVIRGARASATYFDIFGTQAAMGRTFRPDEDRPGSPRVVLLNHAIWRTRFGADPGIVGRDIVLNGEAYTVIGVLPQGGPFDRSTTQIWTPLAFEPASMTRDLRWLAANAKLNPGVTVEEARAEMDLIARRLSGVYPDSNAGRGIAVDRLADVLIGGDIQTAVTLLFAATTFVLLIGCANLANLALARGISQERELSVRAALGATRWRLIRRALVESVLLALSGGAIGVGIGYALTAWIRWLIPPEALPPAIDIRLDPFVLLFSSIAAVVTGLLFGAASAFQSTRPDLVGGLKDGGHGTTPGRRGQRTRAGLIVAETALAFVLLVVAGLFMRSFFNLLEVNPGFDPANVLTASLPISQEQQPEPAALNDYLDRLRSAIQGVPGVQQTAITSALPLQGWGFGVPYSIANRPYADPESRRPAFFKIVSPSYFDALGIPLRAGRALTDDDRAGAPRVVVINETLARREFPDEDPVGQRILVQERLPGRSGQGKEIAWEIVGVVAGEKITGLGEGISPGMYASYLQSPTYGLEVIIRSGTPPQMLQRALRAAVDRVNKDQALGDFRTGEQIVRQSMQGNRVVSMLFTIFAAIALLLAAVGIYGVITYTVAQRRREFGIRAALGASAGSLRMLVFGLGMRLTLIGLAIGLGGTFAATRVLSSMLYGVDARDPLTIAAVAVVLSGVAGLACFVPASRITLDPLEAVRRQ